MKKIIALIMLLIIIIGCSKSSPTEVKLEANIVIDSIETGMKSYGRPYFDVTVKNIGFGIASYIECTIYAINADGVFIDKGFTYFYGNLKHNERVLMSDIIFFHLDSHDDYSELGYELEWYNK